MKTKIEKLNQRAEKLRLDLEKMLSDLEARSGAARIKSRYAVMQSRRILEDAAFDMGTVVNTIDRAVKTWGKERSV